MKTAAYTILKNEKKFIDKWMYYTQPYDYRVLLDTGSEDGSWEMLQEYAKNDRNLIYHYKKIQQLDKYIPAACNFVKYHSRDDDWFKIVTGDLRDIFQNATMLTAEHRALIYLTLSNLQTIS